jgi:hypothetical protein
LSFITKFIQSQQTKDRPKKSIFLLTVSFI